MMKLKRPVAALLAAVLLLGLLTGCHRENGVSFRVEFPRPLHTRMSIYLFYLLLFVQITKIKH